MKLRRQLAVASPVSITAVARAFAASLGPEDALEARASALVQSEFGADATLLTDSGTSALVVALRLAVKRGGVVGFPGYACVDLTAAALYAGVRVRLYDLDPTTMSPDLSSVEQMLERGVDAIVVAHLYGYPADVPSVRRLAEARGVTVIEDAAQGAGGTLLETRLGGLGDLSVLSFGRGKGLCAGGGGALLGFGARWTDAVRGVRLGRGGKGWSRLATTTIQWALGRPSLYALPSAIPWLHLGEMVYHPAAEPTAMDASANSLIASALAIEPPDLKGRRTRAAELERVARTARGIEIMRPISGAHPGYLRFPVRDVGEAPRTPRPEAGILRSYPRTLAEQPELEPIRIDDGVSLRGATELRRSLFTLPTHRFVHNRDVSAAREWLEVESKDA